MRYLFLLIFLPTFAFAQLPPVGPGVSNDLAKWRAAHYSDVRYKLDLTLEKMSPVLKGTIEIRVKVSEQLSSAGGQSRGPEVPSIILDWRKIAGHEKDSSISNVSINGVALKGHEGELLIADRTNAAYYVLENEHLIFRDQIRSGENVIKLDFTSPILTSGSAITRYVDKEDGAEYIYSQLSPGNASMAFPVFDQQDLKANFWLDVMAPEGWRVVSNTNGGQQGIRDCIYMSPNPVVDCLQKHGFYQTKPISPYVFAFAAGPSKSCAQLARLCPNCVASCDGIK